MFAWEAGGYFLAIGALMQILAYANPPAFISANCFDGKSIGIQFDQALQQNSALDLAHYSVTAYGEEYVISSVRLNRDGQSVTLGLAKEIFDAAFDLCLHDIQSTNSETIATICPIITRVNNMNAVRIGRPAIDLVRTESMKNVALGLFEFDVRTEILGGTSDDCLFVSCTLGK